MTNAGVDSGVPTNMFHHAWGKGRSEGYAICDDCGARENTKEAATRCPGYDPDAMNLRVTGCRECARVTGGDCGGHGGLPVVYPYQPVDNGGGSVSTGSAAANTSSGNAAFRSASRQRVSGPLASAETEGVPTPDATSTNGRGGAAPGEGT